MKTVKQTHELILTMINSNVLLQDMDSSDMKNIADALEKRIPQTPHYEGDGYSDGELVYDTWICPSCNESYEIDYENHDYCPCCGQKIDWHIPQNHCRDCKWYKKIEQCGETYTVCWLPFKNNPNGVHTVSSINNDDKGCSGFERKK